MTSQHLSDQTQGISHQDEQQSPEEDSPPPPPPPIDCGLLTRFPVGSVLLFAAVGIGVGVGLSIWEDEEGSETKEIVLKWVGLVGDLFLRALQAVVLPLVVVNVILAIVDMMCNGQAGSIAGRMIGFYILTATLASCVAMVYILIFQDLFREGDIEQIEEVPPAVQLGCGDNGSYLTYETDGSVLCTTNVTGGAQSTFVVHDLDGEMESTPNLSDTLYAGVFERLVTSNIVGSFIEANFAALVVFAVVFGVALAKTVILPRRAEGDEESSVVKLLNELDKVFSLLIMWVLSVTPFAVLSLIAATIGAQNDLLEAFQNVGLLVVSVLLAMLTHFIIVYGGLYMLITRSDPRSYFYRLFPAQTTVFACASSVATIPVTLECVKTTGRVPQAVSRLVVPLGAAVNLDGGAIYFPIACVWLAVLNGLEPSVGDYVLLIIMSTVGSAGTSSVPAASLVLIISAYNTVFGQVGTPYGFSFILAMDWFLDRCRATLNVTGDAVICALVSKVGGLTVDPAVDPAMAASQKEDSITAVTIEEGGSTADDRPEVIPPASLAVSIMTGDAAAMEIESTIANRLGVRTDSNRSIPSHDRVANPRDSNIGSIETDNTEFFDIVHA